MAAIIREAVSPSETATGTTAYARVRWTTNWPVAARPYRDLVTADGWIGRQPAGLPEKNRLASFDEH